MAFLRINCDIFTKEKCQKCKKSEIHGKSLTWIVLSSWALGALTFSGSLEALITKVSMAGLKATIEAATWGSTFKLIQLSTRTVPVINLLIVN